MSQRYADQALAMEVAQRMAKDDNAPVYLVQVILGPGKPRLWEVHRERPTDQPSTEVRPTGN